MRDNLKRISEKWKNDGNLMPGAVRHMGVFVFLVDQEGVEKSKFPLKGSNGYYDDTFREMRMYIKG